MLPKLIILSFSMLFGWYLFNTSNSRQILYFYFMKKYSTIYLVFIYCCSTVLWPTASFAQNQSTQVYDTSMNFENRTLLLLQQLSSDEKVALLQYNQPAIPRLNMAAYNWWNEALHGVARNGLATVFPQAIAMAATWNTTLIKKMGDIVSTEARAKYNDALRKNGATAQYQGLTFWSPNINIFRDPRWGRGQETYGEDPVLTAKMGTAYVLGLQGDDKKYLKVAATAKHFAVSSGPEATRHSFDVTVSRKDLFETYLPAFEALVKKAKVEGVMCAYNRYSGTPCCANANLLRDILRDQWGFKGHVVTDCWAISDMVGFHKTYANNEDAVLASLMAGSELSCGPEMGAMKTLLLKKPSLMARVDTAVYHLLLTRFKLGMFDPPGEQPWLGLGLADVNTPANKAMAKQVALESMVLLKNANHILPLKKNAGTLAIIGPYANNTDMLLGNYNGTPAAPVSFLAGIRSKLGKSASILFASGCKTPESKYKDANEQKDSLQKALSIASKADLVIVVAGISAKLEGEDGDVVTGIEGFNKGDRTTLDLPKDQQELLKALAHTGKKIILVLTGGSAVSINWEKENCQAIIDAWYPGEEGGNALADILFGDYNPAGRLPVSFYTSVNDLPAFDNYDMKNRTYRYAEKTPLFAFGFGLSYTNFRYDSMSISSQIINREAVYQVRVTITNTGQYDGDEVAQLYLKKLNDSTHMFPLIALKDFNRVFIKKNSSTTISLLLPYEQFQYFSEESNTMKYAPGEYEIMVGSSSSQIKLSSVIKL